MNRIPTLRWACPRPCASYLPAASVGRREAPGAHLQALIGIGAAAIVLALLLPWHLGRVQGTSMTPTLQPGSLFLYQRGSLRPDQLRQGDIIVLRFGGELWIKRVFARAGDRVTFWQEDDGTTVRRVPVDVAEFARYERLANWIRRHGRTKVGLVHQQIPAGQVFVLGDDSMTSVDSRTIGPISAAQIVGRVLPLPGQRLAKPPAAANCVALAL